MPQPARMDVKTKETDEEDTNYAEDDGKITFAYTSAIITDSDDENSEVEDSRLNFQDEVKTIETYENNENIMKTKLELETLQVKAIFSLVETISIESVQKKLLFLTNNQATMANLSDIQKFLIAFDIPTSGPYKPKLIINLFYSQSLVESVEDSEIPYHEHTYKGELNSDAFNEKDERIALFLKNYVIPLAHQTNAIIILEAAYCDLSRIMSDLCFAEAATKKGKLPYTVLQFGAAFEYWRSSQVEGTLANEFSRQSKRWNHSNDKIKKILFKGTSEASFERIHMSKIPLLKGASHYVICDGISDKEEDWTPLERLKGEFIQRLSSSLPSIAIQTSQIFGLRGMNILAQHVGRGLPLLLIDLRPKPGGVHGEYPKTIEEAYAILKKRDEELQAVGSWDMYYGSNLAFLKEVFKEHLNSSTQRNHRSVLIMDNENQHSSSYTRRIIRPLYEKIELLKDKIAQDDVGNSEVDNTAEFPKRLVETFKTIIRESDEARLLKATQWLSKLYNHIISDFKIENDMTLKTLDKFIRQLSEDWMYHAYLGYKKYRDELLKKYPDLFQTKAIYSKFDGKVLLFILRLQPDLKPSDIPKVTTALLKIVEKWMERPLILNSLNCIDSYSPEEMIISKPMHWNVQSYVSVYNLLTSPKVYSGNIYEPDKLINIINKVAKIDRLPTHNSIEALEIIRSAWDNVDIFTYTAYRYKWLTKLSYFLLLLLSVSITTATLVSFDTGTLSPKDLKPIIVAFSLCLVVISGISAYFNPAVKWQQLTGNAMILESEVWLFRTRSGKYSTDNNSAEVELALRENIEFIIENVKKSAAVMESAFFSQYSTVDIPKSTKYFTHGQYKNTSIYGTHSQSNLDIFEDDHYSPLTPEAYIKYRVRHVLSFYKGRLPKYYQFRTFLEIFLILGSLSGTLLAILDLQSWAAIITSCTAAVTAWLEFQSTSKKLARYSSAIEQLNQSLLWWKSLTAMDRASPDNVNMLIKSCEDVILGETQAWMATSLVQKMLNKATGNKEETDADKGIDHQV